MIAFLRGHIASDEMSLRLEDGQIVTVRMQSPRMVAWYLSLYEAKRNVLLVAGEDGAINFTIEYLIAWLCTSEGEQAPWEKPDAIADLPAWVRASTRVDYLRIIGGYMVLNGRTMVDPTVGAVALSILDTPSWRRFAALVGAQHG